LRECGENEFAIRYFSANRIDRGRELWEDDELELELEPGDDDLDLGERVERLEKQVERRRETYGETAVGVVTRACKPGESGKVAIHPPAGYDEHED